MYNLQFTHSFLNEHLNKEFDYDVVLKKLSSLKPDKKGTIFCLKSRFDSNCWQIDVGC